MAAMSNYYTQNTSAGQPVSMHYSTWNKEDGASVEPLNDAQPQPLMQHVPEPPVQMVDPNATRLSREHFRTARDNALANTTPQVFASAPGPAPGPASSEESWEKKYWWVWVIVGVVIIGIVAFVIISLKSKQNSVPMNGGGGGVGVGTGAATDGMTPNTNLFGSGRSGLGGTGGILNDLEFL